MTSINPRSRFPLLLLIATLAYAHGALAAEPPEVTTAKAKQWKPVPGGAFADSIHHAVMRYKGQKAPYEQYAPKQIVHIAENVLAGQNADGGWPKNKDWVKVYSSDELATLCEGKSTFDNRSTWAQIDYLARVHRQTGLARYADAARRGIEYLLDQQRDSGGWRGADVDAITFNDDVMAGVLDTLKAVVEDKDRYSFVNDALRERVKRAYDKGIGCVLKCQIQVDGRLTAWCQQHDHKTFEPVWARSFEPPSIVSSESVGIVRHLMSIDDPPPGVIASIQAAVAWLDRVKVKGLRLGKIKAETVKFRYHWANFDRVEIRDSKAPPIWARFYDLTEEKPLFCTRQRKRTRNYQDLSRERRTGYGWYGYAPAGLLKEEYPRWQRKWAPGENVLERARQ